MSAHAPITVDGSAGGQSLRTALTLSLVTQRPFRVESFCAARIAPGLRPRHLALLRAAEALGGRVEGGQAGALAFSFHPRPVASGRPSEPPKSSGLPVTTAVTVWRMCIE